MNLLVQDIDAKPCNSKHSRKSLLKTQNDQIISSRCSGDLRFPYKIKWCCEIPFHIVVSINWVVWRRYATHYLANRAIIWKSLSESWPSVQQAKSIMKNLRKAFLASECLIPCRCRLLEKWNFSKLKSSIPKYFLMSQEDEIWSWIIKGVAERLDQVCDIM